MIAVMATVRARAGKEEELLSMLMGLVQETREEAGCIQYDLHIATDDPASFAFYERWTDQAAFDAHIKTPHVSRAFELVPQLADGGVNIVTYKLVE